jgi:hypothetical protein
LSALEGWTGAGQDAEDYVIGLQYVDTAGTVEEETRIYFRPPAVPGGTWGELYRTDFYREGRLVAVQEYTGSGGPNQAITKVERYEAGNAVSFDSPEGVVFGDFGERYICPATGAVWHKRIGDGNDTGWERGAPPEEEDDE